MNVQDEIHVTPSLDTTLVQQVNGQLTWLIASGLLQPGDLLPSVRELARHLGMNMNTVRSAYLRLEADGLIETR